jgi:hypothetical protein
MFYPGGAQSLPAPLIAGEARQALGGACYVNRGCATDQRSFDVTPAAGTKSVISFPEVFPAAAKIVVTSQSSLPN